MFRTSWLKRRSLSVGAVAIGFTCFSNVWATTMVPAEIVRELSIMKDLQIAVDAFESEYQRYPLCARAALPTDFQIDTTSADLVASLIGQHPSENPRGIVFLDLPQARSNHPGIVLGESQATIVDSFGRHYRIVMDADRDDRVANPDRVNADIKIRSS